MRKLLLLAVLIGISRICFSQANWKSDIDTLRVELPKKHINLFFHKTEQEFNRGLDSIQSQCDTLSDFEIVVKLQQLVAQFGDSHTRVDLFKRIKPELSLPISMYQFTDGVYILGANEENANLIGKKIVTINGYPINHVIDSMNTLITCENDALQKEIFPFLITSTQLLDYFNFSQDHSYCFGIEDDNGELTIQQINHSLASNQLTTINHDNLPYCWQVKESAFSKRYVETDKLLYVSYNKCVAVSYVQEGGNVDTLLFEDFQEQIFKDLKDKKIKKLVFDMRFNGGGNSMYVTKFVEKLNQKGMNRELDIFVVVGRSTFSSAILNTLDFKNNTNAIIVGEETGGKPNHYGEIRDFRLPYSNVDVIYSTKYFKNTDQETNSIVPDKIIETSFQDFRNGIDPVYEWIKKQNVEG